MFEDPTLINQNAEVQWLFKTEIDNEDEMKESEELMNEKSYRQFIKDIGKKNNEGNSVNSDSESDVETENVSSN